MRLTESEIKALSEDPEALRIAANFHQVQRTMGEAMGFDCTYHATREAELLAEAKRVEIEWEG